MEFWKLKLPVIHVLSVNLPKNEEGPSSFFCLLHLIFSSWAASFVALPNTWKVDMR